MSTSAAIGPRVLRFAPILPVVAAMAFGAFELTSAAVPTPEASAVAATGSELYANHCSSCHGVDGAGVDGRGPSLLGEGEAATDFVLRTGRMPLAAPDLQARRGPVRFGNDEIIALVAFVGELGTGPPTPDTDITRGDVVSGGELYRLNCAACHVTSGSGAPIGGGRIAPDLMESSPTQVGQAIVVGPGSMPVFAAFDQRDINDVAAYIDELQRQDTTSASRFGGAGPAAEGLAAWILALIPLVAITRWLGRPKAGRDRPLEQLDDAEPAGEPTEQATTGTTRDG
jgi:ubiquinol-cytochrome c reductase cytochrome c subunit